MLSERNARLDKHDNPSIDNGSGMLTGAQLSALADFLVASRSTYSEPWDKPGTIAALRAIDINVPWYRIGYAAIKAAADPGNDTPAVINLDGHHWDRGQPPCRAHPDTAIRDDGECHGCWLDRKPEPQPFVRPPSRRTDADRTETRRQLEAAMTGQVAAAKGER